MTCSVGNLVEVCTIKLKRCEHCNREGRAKFYRDPQHNDYRLFCVCGFSTNYYRSKEEAAEAWNDRSVEKRLKKIKCKNCGRAELYLYHNYNGYSVRCKYCEKSSLAKPFKKEALAAWNAGQYEREDDFNLQELEKNIARWRSPILAYQEDIPMVHCPFCGANGRILEGDGGYYPRCANEYCIGSNMQVDQDYPEYTIFFQTREEAAAAWNHRVTGPVPPEILAKRPSQLYTSFTEFVKSQRAPWQPTIEDFEEFDLRRYISRKIADDLIREYTLVDDEAKK